jgi:hypothetical protein
MAATINGQHNAPSPNWNQRHSCKVYTERSPLQAPGTGRAVTYFTIPKRQPVTRTAADSTAAKSKPPIPPIHGLCLSNHTYIRI